MKSRRYVQRSYLELKAILILICKYVPSSVILNDTCKAIVLLLKHLEIDLRFYQF